MSSIPNANDIDKKAYPKYGWLCDECKEWIQAEERGKFFALYDEHAKLGHKSRRKVWIRDDRDRNAQD